MHAWGQVVSFDARADVDPAALQRSLNRALRPAVVVRSAAEVAAGGFDARRSATGRRYRYTVRNHPVADPFTAGTAWHVARPLDLAAMRLACDPLLGEHDFSSFCRRPPQPGRRWCGWSGTPVGSIWGTGCCASRSRRRRSASRWSDPSSAPWSRSGTGRRRAGDMAAVVRAGRRSAAGQLAPPHGLCLWEVSYSLGGPTAERAGRRPGSVEPPAPPAPALS